MPDCPQFFRTSRRSNSIFVFITPRHYWCDSPPKRQTTTKATSKAAVLARDDSTSSTRLYCLSYLLTVQFNTHTQRAQLLTPRTLSMPAHFDNLAHRSRKYFLCVGFTAVSHCAAVVVYAALHSALGGRADDRATSLPLTVFFVYSLFGVWFTCWWTEGLLGLRPLVDLVKKVSDSSSNRSRG